MIYDKSSKLRFAKKFFLKLEFTFFNGKKYRKNRITNRIRAYE